MTFLFVKAFGNIEFMFCFQCCSFSPIFFVPFILVLSALSDFCVYYHFFLFHSLALQIPVLLSGSCVLCSSYATQLIIDGLTDCKFRHASLDAGMIRNKQSKLFVCWFAAKKTPQMCKRMDWEGAWKARMIFALKTWNCLLLLKEGWQSICCWSGAFCLLSLKKDQCSVNIAWGVDTYLDLILVSIKKRDQAQSVLPTSVTSKMQLDATVKILSCVFNSTGIIWHTGVIYIRLQQQILLSRLNSLLVWLLSRNLLIMIIR